MSREHDSDVADAYREHLRSSHSRDYDPQWDDDEDDNGAAEGPSFEASMRAKYPLFNDRRR